MNRLIINRPSLQSSSQRMIYPVITFIFWLLWIYIWLPLVSLIAWGFGVQLYYDEMILESGLRAFFSLAGTYGVMIIFLCVSLVFWALYNLKRFKNKERRSLIESLNNEELAEYFHVDPRELTQWHDANRIVVYHSQQGDIDRVEAQQVGD